MSNLSDHNSALRFQFRILLLVLFGAALLWSTSTPSARAKGPVKFRLCGELSCVNKKSLHFTVAMLYGGQLHAAPSCRARVHRVVASMPGSNHDRHFLLVAPRGLIGEQARGGYVWWRKVRGIRKSVLAKEVKPTGTGFVTGPEFPSSTEFQNSIFNFSGRLKVERWRLRSDRITCVPSGLE